MLGAAAKVGKSTLLGNWAPNTTLIVDTHNGSLLLDGEHYVAHVQDWLSFVRVVDDIVKGGHPFHTVGIDLIGDVWSFCDLAHGRQKDGMKIPASGMDDYGRSNAKARAAFNAQIGRLLAAPVGIWFLTHLREKTDKEGQLTAYAPDLDKAIYSKINGAVDFVWLAEVLPNGRRVVHTKQTEHFEAGSRVALPSPLPMQARDIAVAMDRALNPQDYDEEGNRKKPEPEPEKAVPPAPVGVVYSREERIERGLESPSGDVVALTKEEAERERQLVPPTPEPKPVPDDPMPTRDLERTGESDLPMDAADRAWYYPIKSRIEALGLKSADVKGALGDIGAHVPDRVSSWPRTLCRLSDGQRAALNLWLLEREEAGTPLEGAST